jgi:hypothetical protein
MALDMRSQIFQSLANMGDDVIDDAVSIISPSDPRVMNAKVRKRKSVFTEKERERGRERR